MSITLWPFQDEVSSELRGAYRTGFKSPLVVMPTGSGKTVLFTYIAQSAAAKGKKVLILVHRKELLMQTSSKLDMFHVEHGLIAPRYIFNQAPVQVASVHTLIRRLGIMDHWHPDLIIVDEAHHATGKTTWGKILAHYEGAKVLGVTATPERLDGRGLCHSEDGYFDILISGPQVYELIRGGYLSKPVVYAPTTIDTTGLRSIGGDWIRSEAETAADKPAITGSAVKHYRKHSPGEPAIAFCCSVAHAEKVAEDFRAAGYQATSVDGKLDDAQRRQRIEDLGNQKLNVLTSCDLISEGTDIPVVSVGILLRPTQSKALYLQQVGRVLRQHPDKTRSLILDHVGNCMRHGLPDSHREWTLQGKPRGRGKKKDEDSAPPIKQCERCFIVHPPAPRCPACGYVYPVNGRDIEEVEGELQLMSQEQMQRDKLRSIRKEQGMADTLEELEAIAQKRGYKPGWARFVYNAKLRKKEAMKMRHSQ